MKVTCTDYELPTDKFHFRLTDILTASGRLCEAEPVVLTGEELIALGLKKLVDCTEAEIGMFRLHHKHFNDDPADMLNQSTEV